jgi:hypothetical protein
VLFAVFATYTYCLSTEGVDLYSLRNVQSFCEYLIVSTSHPRLITALETSHNMPIDGGATTVLSAVSGALTTTIRITEKVFEILAVGEQSRSLLATIDQVNQQLETARTLRDQKSDLLSAKEKQSINQTFLSTEAALEHVAKLVERARVDQQIHGGRVGFQSRMLFVLRDSPNIVGLRWTISTDIAKTDTELLDGESHAARHRQSATQHNGHHIRPSPEPTYQRHQHIQRVVPDGEKTSTWVRRVSDDRSRTPKKYSKAGQRPRSQHPGCGCR